MQETIKLINSKIWLFKQKMIQLLNKFSNRITKIKLMGIKSMIKISESADLR